VSPPGGPGRRGAGAQSDMERADRAEEDSIRRFRGFEAMWRTVAEAVREAEARRRLELALEQLRARRARAA
jgi:hypothetical protein